jgi:predicted RNase H-like HicB family nuclease
MMEKTGFVYYQENDMWVGWLEEYPDYRTQGKTLEELKENLKDIYNDITSGRIPQVHMRGELVIG